MAGMLYLVSTPIGNLEDLTFRALRVLREVTVIAAEDTRHTQKLCAHYGITTPLTSYHDFNKEGKTPVFLKRMLEGDSIALVSDAGTPLISDPGYYLVTRAAAHNIPVVPIPGASAVLAALASSALPTDTFIFQGFLPRQSGKRSRLLEHLANEPRTLIAFETPHRIERTLKAIQEAFGDRKVVLARELTKIHEEIIRGTAKDILAGYRERGLKGEMTLIIEGKSRRKSKEANQGPTQEKS